MPHSPEQNIHAGQAPTEAGEHDFFLSLSIKRGPKFYEGKRHGTSREVAEVLTRLIHPAVDFGLADVA
jgi:hypothetical protein